MKKKLLVVMLALCLVFSAFAGCTPVEPPPATEPSGTGSGSGSGSGSGTGVTPPPVVATPPADVEGLAVDALGNITWTAGADAIAWNVQYKLGNGDYVQYAVVNEAEVSVTEILKTIDVATLKAANAKNMNVQVAAIDDEFEASNYVELANVLGTYGNNSAKKLRVVETLDDLMDVGETADYVVLANDIIVDADTVYENIKTTTGGVEAKTDENNYYFARQYFNGTLNGLGHTLAYTFVDDQARGKSWGGFWSIMENATMMNVVVDANITKLWDTSVVNMEWWACPYAERTITSTVVNCEIKSFLRYTNTTSKPRRYALGEFTSGSTFNSCKFAFVGFMSATAETPELEWVMMNNVSDHSVGKLYWSAPEGNFNNCTYYSPVAINDTYNPFSNGTSVFCKDCVVVELDIISLMELISNITTYPFTVQPAPTPAA